MKGIIINSDSDGILKYVGRDDALPTSAKDIADFTKEFEGTHITDYFICVASQLVTFPSERNTNVLGKYHTKEENGVPVDYTDIRNAKAAHHIFEELGVDHNKIMIDGFREIGINPWISFRMNDFHYRLKNTETCFLFPDFYYEHPEYRRVKLPECFGDDYCNNAFDYYYEEVRDHYFYIIEEALERYDCFGIELDFQREVTLFGNGREYEGVEIMNSFMRRVKALTRKCEEKYGHPIKTAVHVPSDIQTCFDFGMDVVEWAREGLIDMVIPSGRFESNDNDIPVKLWANLVKPYGVILAPGIEINLSSYPGSKPVDPDIETFAAFAANAYAQGADKIYIYNLFRSDIHERFDRTAELDFDPIGMLSALPKYWTVLNTIGDPDMIQTMNRRHIITYKDRWAEWVRTPMGAQLPIEFKWAYSRLTKLFVGDIPEGAVLTLKIGFKDAEKAIANPPDVAVNAEVCEYIGTARDDRFARGTVLCYSIPKTAYSQLLCPRIAAKEACTVTYVEIYVKVK